MNTLEKALTGAALTLITVIFSIVIFEWLTSL